ncbi:fasciclin domain-containing protein [Robertkochia sediminum]|uniref:fasciclin domain-containing protein n=1 Tax=Robertkochia sediminum TaxID=2785326 RepID=UPI0019327D59|nr:fasciclin domain-containing protein [Robertkochia sediminum]MBL7472684.1 fasciclin domain-containing protein [Robertkochia sediminum]
MMKIFTRGIFLTLLTIVASCNDDDDGNRSTPPSVLSIYETAISSPDLTILVEALDRTGLSETLDEPGTYTVFAPTDEAFTSAGVSLDDFTDDELTNLLLNHVLAAEVGSGDLTTGYLNTLATGPEEKLISLFVNTDGEVLLNGTSSPVADGLDIGASNGVIHLIDQPLNIPNVVDHVVANPAFNSLREVILSFGDAVTDILDEEGPFTIFAPTEEAFANLTDILGEEGVNEEILLSILLYHVVPGQNLQSGDLTPGLEMITANGESLFMDSEDGTRLIDGTGGAGVNILTSDIQGSNGVIHEIDRVLLPPSIVNNTVLEASIYQLAKLTPGYALLAEAIERAGLVEKLSDPDANLTVFAPNDDAFITFLSGFDNINNLADIPEADLANLLNNHLLSGQFTAADIVSAGSGYASTLAITAGDDPDNISLYVNVSEEGVTLNGISAVVFPDFQVSNGIVHLVDAVIDLPTVVTFAAADPNFSTLAEAVIEQGLSDVLGGTEGSPFTVFAPTNEAFADLTDPPTGDALTQVLLHHVVGESNVRSSDLQQGDNTLASLEGDNLLITLPPAQGGVADITDGSGNTGSIIDVDVQAVNGVIHVLDQVMLPDMNN